MKSLIIVVFLFVLISLKTPCQDFHLSQYDQSPLLLNPSLTGNFDNRFRAGINYRDQWKGFDAPFKTISAYFDAKIINEVIKEGGCNTIHNFFGIGTYIYSDKAGDGNLTTTNAMLLFSYNKKLSKSFSGALGFAIGLGNKKIDLNNFQFLSQWNGSNFNSDLPSDLNNIDNSFNYLDINAGLYLSDTIINNFVLSLGSSLNHINKPQNAFFSNEILIPWKVNVHGGLSWGSEKWQYSTSFLYSKQDNFNEVLLGFTTVFNSPGRHIDLNESKMEKYNKGLKPAVFNLIGGIGFRLSPVRDIIPKIGFEMKNLFLQISYDINLLDKYIRNSYQGGFEISIIATI